MITIFVYYGAVRPLQIPTSTEPTSCHAGQHWYNSTRSTSYTTEHNTRFNTGI